MQTLTDRDMNERACAIAQSLAGIPISQALFILKDLAPSLILGAHRVDAEAILRAAALEPELNPAMTDEARAILRDALSRDHSAMVAQLLSGRAALPTLENLNAQPIGNFAEQ